MVRKNQPNENLVLHLGQEELQYLLGMLKVASIPGLSSDMYQDATDREISVAMGVAERALMARGLVLPTEGAKVKPSDVSLALVGTCAYPDYTIAARFQNDQRRWGVTWHGTKRLVVQHSTPLPGIHRFEALADRSSLPDAVVVACSPSSAVDLEIEGVVREDEFLKARDVLFSTEETNVATDALIRGGLSEEASRTLIEIMKASGEIMTVALLQDGTDDQTEMNRPFTLLSTQSGNLRMIVRTDHEPADVEISSLTADEWTEYIHNRVHEFISRFD